MSLQFDGHLPNLSWTNVRQTFGWTLWICVRPAPRSRKPAQQHPGRQPAKVLIRKDTRFEGPAIDQVPRQTGDFDLNRHIATLPLPIKHIGQTQLRPPHRIQRTTEHAQNKQAEYGQPFGNDGMTDNGLQQTVTGISGLTSVTSCAQTPRARLQQYADKQRHPPACTEPGDGR